MAQGFFDAFSAALPQGVQLGMQQQQLEAQQADREAKRNAAL
jgi:hypothetical protein